MLELGEPAADGSHIGTRVRIQMQPPVREAAELVRVFPGDVVEDAVHDDVNVPVVAWGTRRINISRSSTATPSTRPITHPTGRAPSFRGCGSSSANCTRRSLRKRLWRRVGPDEAARVIHALHLHVNVRPP